MRNGIVLLTAGSLMLTACGSTQQKAEVQKFGEVVAVAVTEVTDEVSGQTSVEVATTTETAEISVADIGSDALMSVQRWITVGQDFENYSVGKDGRVAVSLYNNEGSEGIDVWVYTPGKMRVTRTNHFNFAPSFSADGSKLYFTSKRGRAFWGEYDQSHYIWRVSSQGGGGVTRLGHPSYSYEGTVHESPAGDRILYAARELGNSEPYIWMADINGNLPTQISAGIDPSWLSDETILFVANDDNTRLDTIWTQRADGTQLTQLITDTEAHCLHPAPSPDGRYIAYVK